MVDLTTLGIIIGIISQGISALGLVLQKKAHAKIQQRLEEGKPKKKWYADPGWLIAFLIFFGGNLLNLLALTFAPQSIISALVVLVLVFNAIYAPILLDNEKVQKIDIIGVIVIITGIVLVVVFGARVELDYTVSELLDLWINTAFVIYWTIVFSIVIGLIIFIHVVEKQTTTPEIKKMIDDIKEKDKEEKKAEKEKFKSMTKDEKKRYLKEKAEDEEDEAAYNREMGIEKKTPNIPETGPNAPGSPYSLEHRRGKITACMYAVLPAILSSFNALFSKVLGEVVLKTAKGDNQFTHWATYLFIVLFAVVDGIQVVYLQRALRSYSALYIIPLYQVSLTIFGVATGGIYFKEFNAFDQKPSYYPALFAIGLIIAVSGVGILSKRDPTNGADKAKEKGNLDDKEKQLEDSNESELAPEGISPDPKDAPPTTIGTLFVYAVLTGVKWYVKGGDGEQEGAKLTDLPNGEHKEAAVEVEDNGGSSHPSASVLRTPERVPSSGSTAKLSSVNSVSVPLDENKGNKVDLEESPPSGPTTIYRPSTSKNSV